MAQYTSPIGSSIDLSKIFSPLTGATTNSDTVGRPSPFGSSNINGLFSTAPQSSAPTNQGNTLSGLGNIAAKGANAFLGSGVFPTANAAGPVQGPQQPIAASSKTSTSGGPPTLTPGQKYYGATNEQGDAAVAAANAMTSGAQTSLNNPNSGYYNPQSSSTGSSNTGYGVNPPNTIPSNVVGTGLSYNDVLNSRNQIMQQYQDALTNYANTQTGSNLANFNAQFQTPGTVDSGYGPGMQNIVGAQTNIKNQNALLQAQGLGNLLSANATTLNSVNPYSNQISPGSTAFDPSTNQPVNSGMGAAPSTIVGTAQQLAQLAIQNGSAQYNGDGSINMQPYLQQARDIYANGGSLGGQQQGGGQQQNGTQPQGNQGGGGTGQPGYGQNGYGNINMIPQGLQYAVRTDTIGGQGIQYMNASQIPPALLPTAYKSGGPAGIPVLDQAGVGALNAAQQILGIVDAAKALSVRNLKSGTGGRIQDSLTNWANNYLQFNPDLSNFDQLRDAASKATTALSGGNGSGFRMNSGIIEAAVNNLPRAGDNLETALTRADALGTQIINGLKPVFPQANSNAYGNLLQSQYGSGGGQSSSGAGLYNW